MMVDSGSMVPGQYHVPGYGMFMDGDLVVISLPDCIDGRLNSIHDIFDMIRRGEARQLLLDFSGVNEITESGVVALGNLKVLLSKWEIQILILDPSGYINGV